MTNERKSAIILGLIAAIEGAWVLLNLYVNGTRFFSYLGFAPHIGGTPLGWLLAFVVTGLYVAAAVRLPSVRENLFRISWLKLLGIAVAISAGILEEVVFRRWIMNYLQDRHHAGLMLQIIGSGLAFGLAHGVWGLMGKSLRAAIGATAATGILGIGLAIVFVASGRNLAPCIVSHFLINLLIEPGLVLAATRGEMQRRTA
ncbi:MAG TPA: CPBP family intramembrane glutamic endopeptidase [Chthoniobacterales bacterium]|jgi:membrane protease YdiL (CAAX protease family)|nr:CPBP family intramembrane glutamic endopeptidase [Chthoniobacterales bacterium]